jgi:hypothetical protein
MLSNVDKCKVVHFRYKNCERTYEMNGKNLEEISKERAFGLIVLQGLNGNKQCLKSVIELIEY